MKKTFVVFICVSFLACNKDKSPQRLAKEVCDCFAKNQNVSFPDPKTGEAYDECTRMQVKIWESLRDNNDKRIEYNNVLYKCSEELIKKAMEPLNK